MSGFHLVKSCYGQWLPGDNRGSWSPGWDAQIGFTEPHTLYPGDPVRLRMSHERMQHAPVFLTPPMIAAIACAIGQCAQASPWKVVAGAIETTHLHLLLTNSDLDIDSTAKWLAQQLTKSIHKETPHRGPVWAEGKWCQYIANNTHWQNTIAYIESHNLRHNLGARPHQAIPGWY
jgi:REP element-mobilizing transposase RayT